MTTLTKTRWILLMTVALLLITVGVGFTGSESERVLKMAYVAPPPVWGPIADYYAKEVAKIEPALQIKSFGGGQLGPLPKNFADMKMGNLDMVLIDSGVLMLPKGGSHFSVIFAPYAFNSQAHLRKFIASDLFRSMLAKTEKEAGIKYIGWVGDRSPRLITTSDRKVVKPEDMKGLKLRVPMVKPISVVMEAWGASPTPLSASEMYMAMKQGVVDGQDNGFDAIYGAKYYEVQKYVSPINYIRSGLVVVASESVWKKLSDKEQKALIAALEPTDKWASRRNDEIVAKSIKGVQEKGMIILEPDIEAFKRTAAVAVKEKLDGKVWPAGLYEKVKAMD
jgi:TRAP-type C4-dicarboxylate transport system substrate-binding protein